LELSCDNRDRDLFAASTVVTIGDGKTASFWTGRTSKSIAPTLFKKAKRKKITVQKALQGNKWISHISPITNEVEIQEYVLLWEEVHQVQLDGEREDNIVWRWTIDGEYSSKSAFAFSLKGPSVSSR
jgi:hypothetical protein